MILLFSYFFFLHINIIRISSHSSAVKKIDKVDNKPVLSNTGTCRKGKKDL